MATLPVTLDIVIHQGVPWRQLFRWRKPNGEPELLADWAARMQIRRGHGQPVILDLDTDDGGITLDDDGYITLEATATQTATIPGPTTYPYGASTHVYDIELYRPAGGEPVRFAMGSVTISEQVTEEEPVTP